MVIRFALSIDWHDSRSFPLFSSILTQIMKGLTWSCHGTKTTWNTMPSCGRQLRLGALPSEQEIASLRSSLSCFKPLNFWYRLQPNVTSLSGCILEGEITWNSSPWCGFPRIICSAMGETVSPSLMGYKAPGIPSCLGSMLFHLSSPHPRKPCRAREKHHSLLPNQTVRVECRSLC